MLLTTIIPYQAVASSVGLDRGLSQGFYPYIKPWRGVVIISVEKTPQQGWLHDVSRGVE